METVCLHAACGKPLDQCKPLQCAKYKAAKYCSKDCQKKAWKAGHSRECVPAGAKGAKSSAAAGADMQRALLQVMGLRSGARGGPTAAQRRVAEEVIDLYNNESWTDLNFMDADAKQTAEELREVVPQWAGTIYLCLCDCYRSLGRFDEAFEQSDNALAIFEKLDDCIGQGKTLNSIGSCYLVLGQYAQACEAFYKALDIFKKLNDHNGQRTALSGLGNCKLKLGDYPGAIDLFQQDHALVELGDCIGQGKTLNDLGNCYLKDGLHDKAKKMFEESLAIAEKLSDRAARGAVQGPACDGLGRYYESRSEYKMAIKQHNKALAIHIELCDRFGQGCSYNNLGLVLANSGDGAAAADALAKGIVVWQRMEQDVGAPDARRVSVFEEQQRTYRMLQNVLLRQGAAGWALGVAAESKGRALAYRQHLASVSRLGAGGGGDGDDGGDQSVDRPYKVWWAKVQGLARAEGAATRLLEYSFFSEDRMAIWVVSGDTGELLCSKVVKWTGVGVSRGRSIQQVLKEARSSMNVRGRDAMSDSAPDAVARSGPGVPDAESAQLPEELQSTGADAASAQRAPAKDDQGRKLETLAASQASKRAAEMAREVKLLQELYAALIAPVEGALKGAEELLIVPHDLLFEVPWAALTDADGGYLIERYVIRTAPSLRVARKAAEARQAEDKMQQHAKQPPPRVVLVGNPLPTRLPSLRFAEKEVQGIEDILNRPASRCSQKIISFQIGTKTDTMVLPATKTNVKRALDGADWAHMACHADLKTDALVLADPLRELKPKASDLSMGEVLGREGVTLAQGATVVLSACNTGRGDIKAEGVVGLARGFLLANASAAVVSLWSVEDGSTAALMRIKYEHLAEGCTVPQALRLAMLRLARRPDRLAVPHKKARAPEACESRAEDVTDGLKEDWKRPMHWAPFLVVGAATRMPRGTPSQPEAAETVGSEAEAKRKHAGSTSDLAP